jgi:alpha-beta hydrolase superfamily lysophospholipase
MIKRIVVVAFVAAIVSGLSGCSKHKEVAGYGMPVDGVLVNGEGTWGLTATGQAIKGLVVYFHGSDQDAHVIQTDRKHTDLFDPLLRAGYAVVAADAGGNAFGNPASQEAYRGLISAAQQKYIAGPTFFVAESMGALAALALIRDDTSHQVKGMVGVSPLMGLPLDVRRVSYVEGAWGGVVPQNADPLTWPPNTFRGRNFRLYASSTDDTIPGTASATAFAKRFGPVADITVIDCEGGHVATACYQGTEVLDWVTSLR